MVSNQRLEEVIHGACECGNPVVKILNSEVAFRRDGIRYIEPDRIDTRWSMFRCGKCREVIEDTWLPAPPKEGL